jgi:hypothetical protein
MTASGGSRSLRKLAVSLALSVISAIWAVSCQKTASGPQNGQRATPALPAIPDDTKAPDVEITFAEAKWDAGRYFYQGKPFSGRVVKKYASGQPEMIFECVESQMHGPLKEWHENGKPRVESEFRNGERHGDQTYWNPDGSKQKYQKYVRGKVEKEEWFDRPPPPKH